MNHPRETHPGEGYPVGSTIWWRGERLRIASEPFTLYGGRFQDAVNDAGGNVCVASRAQHLDPAEAPPWQPRWCRDVEAPFGP